MQKSKLVVGTEDTWGLRTPGDRGHLGTGET